MNNTKFISTAIPYVNSKPHLGHALEYIQADVYARFLKESGETFFLTGTDDNALKNVQAAEKAGRDVREYVNENAQRFIELDRELSVQYDDFIRTSVDVRHKLGAQKLWQMTKKDDLYLKAYRGFYCTGCEEFKTEKELLDGECPEHPGAKLEEVDEENYFFRLSSYQSELEKLIERDEIKIIPESRKDEALAFIRGGLQDFSVSRSAQRARGWGIPVPGDAGQYLYVWYDALANYITALGFAEDSEEYKKYWVDATERIHVIGKGINRFHTIYWPAMLLSAGLPLPTKIFIHGYITSDGQKMSKSIGNVIDPNDLLKKYGSEATRYLLLRHVHPTEDTDITRERLDEWYTANLVNGLGNLVARVMKLAQDNLASPVELSDDDLTVDPSYMAKLDAFSFNEALDHVFALIAESDALMTERQPFKKVKDADADIVAEGKTDIRLLVRNVASVAAHLAHAMPATSDAILAAVRANTKPENLFPDSRKLHMKLLLTSAGLTNTSIAEALIAMITKEPKDTKIGFIPTAANVENENKDWFFSQIQRFQSFGFEWIDVVDISASGVEWKERLSSVDVILVSGGNTFHLLDQIRKTGFSEWLTSVVDKKVYVGISAGSIVVTPSIAIAGVDDGDENLPSIENLSGLGFVEFEVSPHTPEHVSHEANKEYANGIESVLYGLDDQSAIQVIDGKMEIISEGNVVTY